MRAMVLSQLGTVEPGATPLKLVELPDPLPKTDELCVRVRACRVCYRFSGYSLTSILL